MSKSKGNVVNPDKYDQRVLRFYLMFIGHYFDGGSWNDANIKGIERFFKRFELWTSENGNDIIDIEKFKVEIFNYTDSFKFNKVVSSFMTFYNKNKKLRLTEKQNEEMRELLKIYTS